MAHILVNIGDEAWGGGRLRSLELGLTAECFGFRV